MRFLSVVFIALLFSSAASYGAEQIGIYSEFVSADRLIDYFKTNTDPIPNGPVIINVNADNAVDGAFWEKVVELSKLHSHLRFWVTGKPNTDGYWLNTQSVQTYLLVATQVATQAKSLFQNVEITFDLEPSADVQLKMASDLKNLDLLGVRSYLKQNDHMSEWREAVQYVKQWVDWAHSENISVHAVTNPFVLDSNAQNLIRNQQRIQVPLDPTQINWDEISFMVYRAELQKYLPGVTSATVYEYAKQIKSLFGSKAGIDLGEYGTVQYPAPFNGLANGEDILDDLAAARRAGISKIQLYSFDGILQSQELQDALGQLHQKTSSKPTVVNAIESSIGYWFLNSIVKNIVL